MRLPRLLAIGAILFGGCGGQTEDVASSDADVVASTFRLPGFRETLIASDAAGKIAVVQLGDATKITKMRTSLGAGLVGARSRAGKLWVLAANGKLASVDPVRGTMSKAVAVAARGARDLEMESDAIAWISARDDGRLVRVRVATGAIEDTVSLTDRALDRGRVQPQGMTRVGDSLFVHLARETRAGAPQRGAIAVVDVPTKRVTKVIELQVPGAGGTPEIGFAPDGPMVVDTRNNKLLVTALGVRPADTGMILRVDLARLELDAWSNRFGAGFQGALTLGAGADNPDMYIGYHTSTPQPSTHIFHFQLGADGAITQASTGTVVEAFEVIDNYPTNAARTLLAFPVACTLAFCVDGAGVSFVDTKTATAFPRLGEGQLGLKPTFAAFL